MTFALWNFKADTCGQLFHETEKPGLFGAFSPFVFKDRELQSEFHRTQGSLVLENQNQQERDQDDVVSFFLPKVGALCKSCNTSIMDEMHK